MNNLLLSGCTYSKKLCKKTQLKMFSNTTSLDLDCIQHANDLCLIDSIKQTQNWPGCQLISQAFFTRLILQIISGSFNSPNTIISSSFFAREKEVTLALRSWFSLTLTCSAQCRISTSQDQTRSSKKSKKKKNKKRKKPTRKLKKLMLRALSTLWSASLTFPCWP